MINFMKISVLALFMGFLLVSCGEDEPEVDVREQAVGSYSINMEYVDGAGNNVTDNFSASVELSGENNLRWTLDGDSETLIGVRSASNGLVFNIENSNDTDPEGDAYNIRGTKSISLEGDTYDGTYDSESGEFYLQVEFVYVDRQFADYDAVVTFSGFKD